MARISSQGIGSMFEKIVPVMKSQFGGKRVKRVESLKFAATEHLARLVVPEFASAAQEYPIVFVQDRHGKTNPYLMLGLTNGTSLAVDAAGKWRGRYVPAVFRRYPFILVNTGKADSLAVGFDEESGLISDTEGEPMFDADGKPAGVLKSVVSLLNGLQAAQEETDAFCAALAKQELLKPLRIETTSPAGRRFNITGVMAIEEQALSKIPDDVFLEWRKRGWIGAVYAHLISLGRVMQLLERADETIPKVAAAGGR